MLFLISKQAQPSCFKQHFDNNLGEILKDLHVVMATPTKSKSGVQVAVAGSLQNLFCNFLINKIQILVFVFFTDYISTEHQIKRFKGKKKIIEILSAET